MNTAYTILLSWRIIKVNFFYTVKRKWANVKEKENPYPHTSTCSHISHKLQIGAHNENMIKAFLY